MYKISPLISVLSQNSVRYVQRPNVIQVRPETLRPVLDELCLSTKKQVITINEVKNLFPIGKLEENYITRDIKNLLANIKTDRKVIDLTPELSEKDYEIIQKFMNTDNGRYIAQWKGFSDTDIVRNIQKLALFTRTMRLTKQTQEFLEFDPNQWNMVVEGITKKPRDMIMPLLLYKANSNPINIPLGEKKISKELKSVVDKITDYLNMFTVKKDFTAYRGDLSFGILSGVKYEGQNINLADLIEKYTLAFQDMYQKNVYNNKAVDDFVQKYLVNQKIEQPRFMSIGMTESSIKDYAKKIKWKITVPKGTKGASIESFNVERLNEAEFLGQRNGVFKIRDAR